MDRMDVKDNLMTGQVQGDAAHALGEVLYVSIDQQDANAVILENLNGCDGCGSSSCG